MVSATWPGRSFGAYRGDAAEVEFAGVIVQVAEIVVTDRQSLDIGTFLEFVTSLVRDAALVLVADNITEYGEVRWQVDDYRARGADLVESVGNCSTIYLRDLGAKRTSAGVIQSGWLVGQQPSIRYLCSCANPLPPASAIFESRRVRIDYRPFARLWRRPIPIKESVPPEQWMDRRLFVSGVGSAIAQMHLDYLLHGDAHRDNFAYKGGLEVVPLDFGSLRMLYRAPSIEQCAASMVPLMSTLVYPEEWDWFRDGYIAKRGADGLRVFDFIQRRDLTLDPPDKQGFFWGVSTRKVPSELGRWKLLTLPDPGLRGHLASAIVA